MKISRLLFVSTALVALAACDTSNEGTDSDGDGIMDGREEVIGTDPDSADTDGDGLSDGEEYKELGTDPLLADTDGDGWDDGEEHEAGTDGNVCWSVPEGYADCSKLAEGRPAGDGTDEMDSIFDAWPMTDSYGEAFTSDRFYGMIVVVDISAGWCGPCNAAAPGMEETYLEYKDDGVVIVHMMIEDWVYGSGNVDQTFLGEWRDEHGLSFPITMDHSYDYNGTAYSDLYIRLASSGVYEGYVPTFLVFDREHRLVAKPGSDAEIETVVQGLL